MVRYEDLVEDPLSRLAELYEHLQLCDFAPAENAMQQYAQRRYKRNVFPEIAPELRQQIDDAWAGYFEQYGYERGESVAGPADAAP